MVVLDGMSLELILSHANRLLVALPFYVNTTGIVMIMVLIF